ECPEIRCTSCSSSALAGRDVEGDLRTELERVLWGDAVSADAPTGDPRAVGRAEVEREQLVPNPKEQKVSAGDCVVVQDPVEPRVEAVETAAEDDAVVERLQRQVDRRAHAATLNGQP